MAAVQISELRTRIRKAAEQTNTSGKFSDDDINALIAEGATELYDLLIKARGAEYYSTQYLFNTTAGHEDSDYLLPADFYRLVAIAVSETAAVGGALPRGASWTEPQRFVSADLAQQLSRTVARPSDLRYALSGTQSQSIEVQGSAVLRFYPAPEHVWCVRIVYLPTIYDAGEADALDVVNGWGTFVVAHAVADMSAQQEEEAAFWLAKKEGVARRIQALAGDRDRAVPIQVADRRGMLRGSRTLPRMR